MTEDKILFFASGNFAIDTFKSLLDNGFNVVGLVTSNDKVKFHNDTISKVTETYDIPVYVVKNNVPLADDKLLIEWISNLNADIFCVISFKKLPQNIISLANKCAFNIHASLLPYLKGAAPINWAIRLGYKETGLTAFVLNDKIDGGDIIASRKINIDKNQKFTSLFDNLSKLCIDFTQYIINDALQKENWQNNLIQQNNINDLFKARKINQDYFKIYDYDTQSFETLVNSVDDIGWSCKLQIKKNGVEFKILNIKMFEVEEINLDTDKVENNQTISDGKIFINIVLNDKFYSIKKLQLENKKIMDTKNFLNGFRYFRDKEYNVKFII